MRLLSLGLLRLALALLAELPAMLELLGGVIANAVAVAVRVGGGAHRHARERHRDREADAEASSARHVPVLHGARIADARTCAL